MTVAVACAVRFGTDVRSSGLGGGERYPTALARALCRLTPTDLVVFGEPSPAGFLHMTTTELGVPGHPSRTERCHVAAAAWLLNSRYSVVHFVQDNELAAVTALTARLRPRSAKVFLTPVGGGRGAGLNRLRIAECFTGFLTISEYSRHAYRWLSSTARPVHVIYGGGDPVGANDETPSAVVTADERRHVLFVGRILPHKGVDVLLRALPAGVPAVVAGALLDRSYHARLGEIVATRGLDVTFALNASDPHLRALYSTARVTVLPTVEVDYTGRRHAHPELLGLALLEAMWHGSPVIGSDLGGIPEIIKPDYGSVVPAGDVPALARALRDSVDGTALSARSAAARAEAQSCYSWDRVARRAIDIYSLRANIQH